MIIINEILVRLMIMDNQLSRNVIDVIANSTFYDVAGLFGVLFYVGSYGALQLGRINGNALLYSGLNATAAIFVLISLYKNFNLASALIQIVWVSVSVAGACRILMSTKDSKKHPKVIIKSHNQQDALTLAEK